MYKARKKQIKNDKKKPIGKSNRSKKVTCNLECVIETRINQPYLWL